MSDSCVTPETPLVVYDEAISLLLQQARPVRETESVPLGEALGRILAEEIASPLNVPPLDNSAMDGYAVRTGEITPGKPMPVSQRIPAGTVGTELEPGTCARIFTGAPVPPGADAVIMQERAADHANNAVSFESVPRPGDNIRNAGEDIRTGDMILEPGNRIEPQHLGLAASVGLSELGVFRRLRVATFFTGDEIVEPGKPLREGEIYNSNQYHLNALLQKFGCDVVNLGIVEDRPDTTRATILEAARSADLVVTSGGVSVGEEDHVRLAIEELGTISMWRLKIKPGKPLVLGHVQGTPIIGLPGNPVSAFVTCLLFVRPFLLRMQGLGEVLPSSHPVTADFDWTRPGIRREFLRARVRNEAGEALAEIHPRQGSGVLSSTCWANGLVVIPEETRVAKGDRVQFIPFRELM
ncbi:MAG: molybdopterin molybdotransferase MoeA [Sedimenticolaceae bacterium]|nr:molybdopterin molybdotransferase MoeA [Sedimenticolaceae bacterium]